MVGRKITILMPERYRMRSMKSLRRYLNTGEKRAPWQDIELYGLHKSGSEIPLEASYSDYVMKGKHYFTRTFRDITERKAAEAMEREVEIHKRDFYRRTIFAATEGKLVICEPEETRDIAGPALASWTILGLEDIDTVRDGINEAAIQAGMDAGQCHAFAGCAIEAMANAYKHADGGAVSLHRVGDGLMLLVSDTGAGIEALALPEVALTKGYTTGASLGMGYKVMIEFADKVYLSTSPKGTVVGLRMGLHPARTAGDALLEKQSGW